MKMKSIIIILFLAVVAMASSHLVHKHPRCEQPIEKGTCRAHFYKYGYDTEKKECVEFVYSGCGGNHNRFHSKHICELMCIA